MVLLKVIEVGDGNGAGMNTGDDWRATRSGIEGEGEAATRTLIRQCTRTTQRSIIGFHTNPP